MGQYRDHFLSTGVADTEFNRFCYAVEHSRKRFPIMTIGTLSTFLAIAEYGRTEALTPSALAERLALSFTTVYRQCDQLSEGARGQPGLGLIKKIVRAEDARARVMVITLKGLAFHSELMDILQNDGP